MKKTLLVSTFFLLFLGIMNAQNKQDNQNSQEKSTATKNEFLMMKNGKVCHIVNGKQIQLQIQMTMKNGAVVNPDGSCKFKDGKQLKLHNGECMDMNGKTYHSQEMFHERMLGKQNMNGNSMMNKGTEPKNMGGMNHH